MTFRLIYETHSITIDNEEGIATGWLPGALSTRGRDEAARLGERRRHDDVAAVYVSDLHRAVETAEIAFAEREVRIIQDARLRECNYGDLNGMPVATLAKQRRSRINTPFPGGQSYHDVVVATRSFLGDMAARHDGQRILVVSHSANRWALQHLLHGIPLEDLVDAPFNWQPGWEFMVKCDPLP